MVGWRVGGVEGACHSDTWSPQQLHSGVCSPILSPWSAWTSCGLAGVVAVNHMLVVMPRHGHCIFTSQAVCRSHPHCTHVGAGVMEPWPRGKLWIIPISIQNVCKV